MSILPPIAHTDPDGVALRILLVDSEPTAARCLKALIGRAGGFETIGTIGMLQPAREAIHRLAPDIVFVDVDLAGESGFDLLSGLPEDLHPVLIVQSVSEHDAFRAFEGGASDFLLKPLDPVRVAVALQRASHVARARQALSHVVQLRAANLRLRSESLPHAARYLQELWVRGVNGEAVRLPVSAIDWVARVDDYVCIHVDGRQYLHRTSLAKLSDRLDPREFVRLHRSALARLDRIASLERATEDRVEVVLRSGVRLPAGRTLGRTLRLRLSRRDPAMCDMEDTDVATRQMWPAIHPAVGGGFADVRG